MLDQRKINDFTRTYFNQTIKKQEGVIHHDPGTGKEHRALVNSICEWANTNNYTYFTRVHLKEGKIVDIVIPELVKPFIEVRDSEEKKDKEYLTKYEDLIQFVDVSDPYTLR
jgi:hypothetical protein